MKYNIIGDIHGRSCWKELVKDDCTNIFVGDYFDPYDMINSDDCIINLQNIIDYKTSHPETILLQGNHDMHYLTNDKDSRCSRFNFNAYNKYHAFLTEYKDMFYGVAYNIENKFIVSHAGISVNWYEKWNPSRNGINYVNLVFKKDKWIDPDTKQELNYDPGKVVDFINTNWNNENYFMFDFLNNATNSFDCYGDSCTHSPVWIRPYTLLNQNIFKGTDIKQIIGHTQVYSIGDDHGLVLVDVLGRQTPESYVIEI